MILKVHPVNSKEYPTYQGFQTPTLFKMCAYSLNINPNYNVAV